MAKRKRAADVIPPRLLKEIQKYYSGGYLRIPAVGNNDRNRQIHKLRKKGLLHREIAEKMGISERTTYRVLNGNRRPDTNTET